MPITKHYFMHQTKRLTMHHITSQHLNFFVCFGFICFFVFSMFFNFFVCQVALLFYIKSRNSNYHHSRWSLQLLQTYLRAPSVASSMKLTLYQKKILVQSFKNRLVFMIINILLWYSKFHRETKCILNGTCLVCLLVHDHNNTTQNQNKIRALLTLTKR